MAVINITIPDCDGCCGVCGGLPDSLNATIAGLASCGCVGFPGSGSSIMDATTILNGSFTDIEKVPDLVPDYTIWRKQLGEVGITSYFPADDCTGTPEPSTSYWTLFIVCNGLGELFLQVFGSQSGYPENPFESGLLSAGYTAVIEEIGEVTPNALDCDAGGVYAAGGTGKIEIP